MHPAFCLLRRPTARRLVGRLATGRASRMHYECLGRRLSPFPLRPVASWGSANCMRGASQPQPHPHCASLASLVSDNGAGARIVKGSNVEVCIALPFRGKGEDVAMAPVTPGCHCPGIDTHRCEARAQRSGAGGAPVPVAAQARGIRRSAAARCVIAPSQGRAAGDAWSDTPRCRARSSAFEIGEGEP